MKNISIRFLLIFSLTFIGCEKSFGPDAVDIVPGEGDPPPNFRIAYHRDQTPGAGGWIESIQFTLIHLVQGELPDYGAVSFGGVSLYRYSILNEPEQYYNYLQSNIPGKAFDPVFRFEQGNLAFKIENSPAIADVSQTLTVPPVCRMMDVVADQNVDVNADWQIAVNRTINGARWILQPNQPKAGAEPITVEQSAPNQTTQIIPAATLLALQGTSLGNRYLLTLHHVDFGVDTIIVSGRGTSQSVSITVDLVSCHCIEFLM